MLLSRNWLQSYFENELPNVHELAETLLLHSFEIEEVIETETDGLIDIDVLPNRAHDCLSHQGIAHELAGLLQLPLKESRYLFEGKVSEGAVTVVVEKDTECRRYMACSISDVVVGDSPAWLKERLKGINQKSINNLVDVTNYIMFDLGQPLHVFDADKVVGKIYVRNAYEGETMVTLSKEELTLESHDVVIADDEGVLALAGVKGGMKAEVTEQTTAVIFEIGNFDPIRTRKTARRVKLFTDASKRFENECSPVLVDEAYRALMSLLDEVSSGAHTTRSVTDVYVVTPEQKKVTLSLSTLSSVLGVRLEKETVAALFDRFSMSYEYTEGTFVVSIPPKRLDLSIQEDLIEEIGRWYGYHNIPVLPLPSNEREVPVHSATYFANKVRTLLCNQGYSDMVTYSFVKKGEITLLNPIASDKQALRTSIVPQLLEAGQKNATNAILFGSNRILLFEIGRVYLNGGEETHCAVVCINTDKKARKEYGAESEQLEKLKELLDLELGTTLSYVQHGDQAFSFSIDALGTTSEKSYGEVFSLTSYPQEARFSAISPYPFSNRDISLWVTEGTGSDEVGKCIEANGGPLLKKYFLFDEFTKEGKTSYAFSMIFQSLERTLEESDIDEAMKNILSAVVEQGWEVR